MEIEPHVNPHQDLIERLSALSLNSRTRRRFYRSVRILVRQRPKTEFFYSLVRLRWGKIMRKTKLWLLVVITTIAGCAPPQHEIRRSNPEGPLLTRSDSVYVAVPKDAIYRGKTYWGSGLATSKVLLSFFTMRDMRAEIARSHQSFDDAKDSALESNYKYLFYPTIIRWEDRTSEWTGKTDQIEIWIEVVEVSTGEMVDSSKLISKSDIVGSGLGPPQWLLSELFSNYVHGLLSTR